MTGWFRVAVLEISRLPTLSASFRDQNSCKLLDILLALNMKKNPCQMFRYGFKFQFQILGEDKNADSIKVSLQILKSVYTNVIKGFFPNWR